MAKYKKKKKRRWKSKKSSSTGYASNAKEKRRILRKRRFFRFLKNRHKYEDFIEYFENKRCDYSNGISEYFEYTYDIDLFSHMMTFSNYDGHFTADNRIWQKMVANDTHKIFKSFFYF